MRTALQKTALICAGLALGFGAMAQPKKGQATQSSGFTLQVLHASDFEAGTDVIPYAQNFAAIVDKLEDTYPNTIRVSSGDNFIPSPFSNAAGTVSTPIQNSLRTFYNEYFTGLGNATLGTNTLNNVVLSLPGRVDMSVLNAIGIQASALGNHEFDFGTNNLNDITALARSGSNTSWPGTQFPYLSSNLNFSGDASLSARVTNSVLEANTFATPASGTTKNTIAPSCTLTVNGEKIGIVGVTTPLLANISSPGFTTVKTPGAGTNDMAQLASIVQPFINALVSQGVNKIIVLSHLQQIQLEQALIPLLQHVDVVVGGGSHTIWRNPGQGLVAGDVAFSNQYPLMLTNASGKSCALVNTGANYRYVGRLVVTFDNNGDVVPGSIDPSISGSYKTDNQGLLSVYNGVANAADVFTTGNPNFSQKGKWVKDMVDAVNGVVQAKDGIVLGYSNVYLEGNRTFVRNEETNLGNLTADANLWYARQVDPTVAFSMKNGGGIRTPVGSVKTLANGTTVNEPNLANPGAGKPAKAISQLDIENTLRFNNLLSIVTLTAAQFRNIIEHGIANWTPTSTEGRMLQISGFRLAFDPTRPVGSRIRSMDRVNMAGTPVETLVQDFNVVSSNTFKMVTLNFMVNNGDGYPFKTAANGSPLNYSVEVPLTPTNTTSVTGFPNTFTFATGGSEQDAMAEYMNAFYPNTASMFQASETPINTDLRIQNLYRRADAISAPSDLVHSGGPIAAGFYNNVTINGDASLSGNINVAGTLTVNGTSVFSPGASFITGPGNVVVANNASIATAVATVAPDKATAAGLTTGNFRNFGARTINGGITLNTGVTSLGAGFPESVGRLGLNISSNTLTLAKNLKVTNGLTLTSGTLTTGGFLTMSSDANGVATLANFGANTGTLSGTVNLERFYNLPVGQSTLVGMPVASTIAQTGIGCSFIRVFNEPTNSAVAIGAGCSPSTANRALFYYGGSQSNMIKGTGTLTNTDQPMNISRTAGSNRGFNALFNPFLSNISWTDVAGFGTNSIVGSDPNSGQISGTAWVWNPSLGNYGTITKTGVTANLTSANIAPYQGFLVRKAAIGNGVVTIPASARTANAASSLRKAQMELVKLSVTANGAKDQVAIYSHESGESAAKLSEGSTISQLSLVANNEEQAIVATTTIGQATLSLPVVITATTAGTHTIAIDEMSGMAAGTVVVLTDLISGQIYDLTEGNANINLAAGRHTNFQVTINPSSVVKKATAMRVSLSPNPAKGVVAIEGLDATQATVATVTAANGVQVLAAELAAGQRQLTLTQVPAGIYSLNLKQGDSQSIVKLVVE